MITDIVETLAQIAQTTLRTVALAATVKPLRRSYRMEELETYTASGQVAATIIEGVVPEVVMWLGVHQITSVETMLEELRIYLEDNSGQELEYLEMSVLVDDWHSALSKIDLELAEMVEERDQAKCANLLYKHQVTIAAYARSIRVLMAYRIYRLVQDFDSAGEMPDFKGGE